MHDRQIGPKIANTCHMIDRVKALMLKLSALLLCGISHPLHAQSTQTYTDIATFPYPAISYVDSSCPATVIRTINVSDSYIITDLDVGIIFEHDFREDVEMTLESPDGTRIQFAFLGAGINLNARFDDEETDRYQDDFSSHSVTATPYFDTFEPDIALSGFDGENVNGIWTLEICDNFSADDGTFRRFELFISGDYAEDLSFPTDRWRANYCEGRDGTPGSASWGSAANGSGGAGSKTYHGKADFGIDLDSVFIGSNGSASFNRWSNTETPTDPAFHDPGYLGTSWSAVGDPHYQIDLRRETTFDGNLKFGSSLTEIVDDVLDVYINGVRVYAYFPSGGAPDPRPGGGQEAIIPFNSGDEILIRFINLGFIGGFSFQYDLERLPAILAISKTSEMADTGAFSLPGNDVIYQIHIQNAGDGPSDSNSIFVVDSLPSEVSFFNGDYNGTDPGIDVIGFTQTGTALTFGGSDVAYSNSVAAPSEFADCTYAPAAGFDPNVRHICINPKGVMPAGGPFPNFNLFFRVRID